MISEGSRAGKPPPGAGGGPASRRQVPVACASQGPHDIMAFTHFCRFFRVRNAIVKAKSIF
jgi:hypothetical protein